MTEFYRKNQDIAIASTVKSSDIQERKKVESRVRPLSDFFPESKPPRLQPISQDIGRHKRQVGKSNTWNRNDGVIRNRPVHHSDKVYKEPLKYDEPPSKYGAKNE